MRGFESHCSEREHCRRTSRGRHSGTRQQWPRAEAGSTRSPLLREPARHESATTCADQAWRVTCRHTATSRSLCHHVIRGQGVGVVVAVRGAHLLTSGDQSQWSAHATAASAADRRAILWQRTTDPDVGPEGTASAAPSQRHTISPRQARARTLSRGNGDMHGGGRISADDETRDEPSDSPCVSLLHAVSVC